MKRKWMFIIVTSMIFIIGGSITITKAAIRHYLCYYKVDDGKDCSPLEFNYCQEQELGGQMYCQGSAGNASCERDTGHCQSPLFFPVYTNCLEKDLNCPGQSATYTWWWCRYNAQHQCVPDLSDPHSDYCHTGTYQYAEDYS